MHGLFRFAVGRTRRALPASVDGMARRIQRPSEDPAVADVERLLTAAATRSGGATDVPDGRPAVATAMWVCACETELDAPTWLIYDTADGKVGWCRVPNGISPLDLVAAELCAGGHDAPESVHAWLQGEWALGSGECGGIDGDRAALDRLASRIRSFQPS